MAFLYLTEQGSVLRKSGERIIVAKNGETLLDVPSAEVQGVLLYGNIQVTTQALHELLREEVELALLTRNGKLVGQITSPATKNVLLRLAQFRKHEDLGFRLDFGRTIVGAKIANSLAVLQGYSWNHPEAELGAALDALRGLAKSVETAADLPGLLGYEGAAAAAYFGAFAGMMRGEFAFDGRKMHPPPDPVNALLSLGYTMLSNEIASLLDGIGFDPYVGFLHEISYGRPSLAVDLVEEFRCVAERLTLFLVNNRVFGKDDFYPNPRGGIYLERESLKRYLAEYEKTLSREFRPAGEGTTGTVRSCFRRQAERLARVLAAGERYTPFRLDV